MEARAPAGEAARMGRQVPRLASRVTMDALATWRWLALLLALFCSLAQAQFDPSHSAWDGLVKRHVQWLPDNRQSRVDYAAFQRDRGELKKVLDAMSAVSRPTFD